MGCLLFRRMCRGIYKVHYFAPFQNCWNVREKRQRAIQGVREVVETASDKMSAAPELNPGDWKWIECISPYIDSCWHRGDSDREEERRERGELEWVNEWDEDEEKEHRGERKRAVVCYQLTTGAFQTPLLSHYTITETKGSVFTKPCSISGRVPSPLAAPAERPTTSPRRQHREMDTIGRARLIPGWQEQEGIGFLGVKMP